MDFKEEYTLTCDVEENWTEFFHRTSVEGDWLSADGIFTVALNGNDSISSADVETKTLFIFSDTLIGDADKNGNITDRVMANHSAAVLEGNLPVEENVTFFYGSKGSLDTENGLNLFDKNQWLFDCFVHSGSVFILAFTQESWKPACIDIIEIPVSAEGDPIFAEYTRTENVTSLLQKNEGFDLAFGAGIMNNTSSAKAEAYDGYIYFYGFKDDYATGIKDMIVARLHENDLRDFSKLTYWNGTEWSENIGESAVILENVSCELSVTYLPEGPFKGKYMAVYTQRVESERIMYAIGDSPVGPFYEPVQIFTAPEYLKTHGSGEGFYYTYNAKAHPHISADGSLLITYNVNVRDRDAAKTEDYHPRFLKLDWN